MGALVFLVGEALVARAWSGPGYSYRDNFISDLGNPQCGPYDGRMVCSPLHWVMNGAFVTQGVLLGCAVWLAGRMLEGRSRAAVFWAGGITAAGFVLTGVAHSSPEATENGMLWLHYLGATLAILGGNATAILVSRQSRRMRVPAWVGAAGTALGTLGIVAALTWLATFRMLPPGLLERIAAYAFMLWQIGFGGYLLHVAQPMRTLLRRSPATTGGKTGQ
ncbi:DUF998 domain-containing protein [Dactylosporangium vinaceum]|uniref:DUF998 domain-containing protein n=1 Tax=Dactylosporangium vinaceum TaxID=53362 RepID=A0ABV5MQW7_9ACTN|nr:DUF998 domain-containing protein [Dactylosporangium vinaceum]